MGFNSGFKGLHKLLIDVNNTIFGWILKSFKENGFGLLQVRIPTFARKKNGSNSQDTGFTVAVERDLCHFHFNRNSYWSGAYKGPRGF